MSQVVEARRGQPPLPETLDLAIDRVLSNGDGIGSWDGREVAVRFVLPGELVRVRPFWAKMRRGAPPLLRADLIEVPRPSPARVTPACPYFGGCGGCQYQHAEYGWQLAQKGRHLAAALAEYPNLAGIEPRPVIGCPDPYGYRNQIRLSLDRQGQLCFTLAGRRRTFPVAACAIAAPAINEVLSAVTGRATGRHQVAIRTGFQTGDRLVFPPPADAAPAWRDDWLTERILGETFRISHSAFFQVNTRPFERDLPDDLRGLGWPDRGGYSQADLLALGVLAAIRPGPNDRVVDAYAGVGVFARLLAPRCRSVVAIEESAPAVADAQFNLAHLPNVELRLAKTEAAIATLDPAPDAVILDPARPGCAPEIVRALIDRPVDRLAYVSCEPATLARDLAALVDVYAIDWLQPIDMFPQTRHLETVVGMRRRG